MKFLRELPKEFARRAELRLHRKHEIGRYDGIALVDLYDDTPYFERTLVGALELIKSADPKHFASVLRYIRCIVNCTLPRGGATYRYAIRTCEIDFKPPASDRELPYFIAWYACTLIHWATHGRIRARNILYTRELRGRIEQLCVSEEERCVHRLPISPEVSEWLTSNKRFDPSRYESGWTTTPRKDFISTGRGIQAREPTEPERNRPTYSETA